VSAAKVSALVVFLAGTSRELELELESEEGDLRTGLGAGIGGLPARGPVGRSMTRSGVWFDVLTLGVVLDPQPGLALSSPGLFMLLLSHRSFLRRKLLVPPVLLVVELLLSLLSRLSCLLARLVQLFCFSTTPASLSSCLALVTLRGRAPRETGDLAPSRPVTADLFLSVIVTGDFVPSNNEEILLSVAVTGHLTAGLSAPGEVEDTFREEVEEVEEVEEREGRGLFSMTGDWESCLPTPCLEPAGRLAS